MSDLLARMHPRQQCIRVDLEVPKPNGTYDVLFSHVAPEGLARELPHDNLVDAVESLVLSFMRTHYNRDIDVYVRSREGVSCTWYDIYRASDRAEPSPGCPHHEPALRLSA